MNLLDFLIFVIVAASVVAGFVAGFARAAIGFIAVMGGILLGFWFYGIPAGWIHHFVKSDTAANIFGFAIVFFAFQLAGGLLAKLLATLFKWTGLSFIDRILGAGFGLVRGALMAVAFVAVLLAFTPSDPPPTWMTGSLVLPYAIDASNICAALAPNGLKTAFRKTMKAVRDTWEAQVDRAEEYRRGKQHPVEPKPLPKPKSDLRRREQ